MDKHRYKGFDYSSQQPAAPEPEVVEEVVEEVAAGTKEEEPPKPKRTRKAK